VPPITALYTLSLHDALPISFYENRNDTYRTHSIEQVYARADSGGSPDSAISCRSRIQAGNGDSGMGNRYRPAYRRYRKGESPVFRNTIQPAENLPGAQEGAG